MTDYKKVSQGRDYTVELWRFVFCIVVLGLHFFSKTSYSFFRAGYLGVEFFFLLSGFGIWQFYLKKMAGQKLSDRLYQFGLYIGGRLKRLYPLYLLSLLCMLFLRTWQYHWSIREIIAYLKTGWAEFLMLQCGPLGNEVLISANWYVAAMFMGSILLLCLLMLAGRWGGLLICPVLSLSIYHYYFRLIRKIDVIYSYHAVLRALAGLGIGIFIGSLIRLLQEKVSQGKLSLRISTGKKKLLQELIYCLANGILAAIVIYTNFGRRSAGDFVVIALFAVCLFGLFLVKKEIPQKLSVVFQKLGAVTYPVYLFQMPIIEWLVIIGILHT